MKLHIVTHHTIKWRHDVRIDEDPIGLAASSERKSMQEYRCYTVGPDGHFQSCKVIEAANDEDAVKEAESLTVDGPVEVWLLDRKVAVLSQESHGS